MSGETQLQWLMYAALCIIVLTIIMLLVFIITSIIKSPGLVLRYRRRKGEPRKYPVRRPALADGLERVKCKECAGSGSTQMLWPDGQGWKAIPPHLLYKVWNKEDQDFDTKEPLYANIRSCTGCAGRAYLYRDVTGSSGRIDISGNASVEREE